MTHRIDTHHHIVPPRYRTWLEARGRTAGGKAIPHWSAENALRFMDANGVAVALMSVSTPGAYVGNAAEARDEARRLNEEAAELVAKHARRFGYFATLCVPDIESSIAELDHAYDALKADGVVLMTNTDGVYLGDPSLDPLMAALNRRSAVVFVHPADLPAPPVPGIEPFVADFLLDSVRAAINIAKADLFGRFPNIRFILSHGGGFLPFAASRIARACAPDGDMKAGIARLRRFHFDTALASSQYALPSLLAFADPELLTFGSDIPYAADDRAAWFTSSLDRYDLAPDLRTAIASGNALKLFPRLATIL